MAEEQANLGLATTRDLLKELEVRFDIPTPDPIARRAISSMLFNFTEEYLNYRTVDGEL